MVPNRGQLVGAARNRRGWPNGKIWFQTARALPTVGFGQEGMERRFSTGKPAFSRLTRDDVRAVLDLLKPHDAEGGSRAPTQWRRLVRAITTRSLASLTRAAVLEIVAAVHTYKNGWFKAADPSADASPAAAGSSSSGVTSPASAMIRRGSNVQSTPISFEQAAAAERKLYRDMQRMVQSHGALIAGGIVSPPPPQKRAPTNSDETSPNRRVRSRFLHQLHEMPKVGERKRKYDAEDAPSYVDSPSSDLILCWLDMDEVLARHELILKNSTDKLFFFDCIKEMVDKKVPYVLAGCHHPFPRHPLVHSAVGGGAAAGLECRL